MASQMKDARVLKTTVEITAAGDEPPSSPRRARRSSLPGSGAPTWKAATTRRPSSRIRRRFCRPAPSATASARGVMPGREGLAFLGLDAKKHETLPPAALHRSGAHQGAGGGGHRPAVHLRVDHPDDPEPRLRLPAGQGAGALVHGVCRHRAAAPALRRLRRRRLHGRDGRSARRDQQRRARVAGLRPHVLSRRRPARRAGDV